MERRLRDYRVRQRQTARLCGARGAVFALLTLGPAIAPAQQPDTIEPTQAPAAESAESRKPSSTETGQSPLDESFGPRTRAEWIRETRRKAWQDTRFDVQARTYYLDRDKFDNSQSEAWALGGSVGLKTGYFRERFALGATGYTSQRLHGPEDNDGSLLLQSGQHGYAVLGELLWRVSSSTRIPGSVWVAAASTRVYQSQRQPHDTATFRGHHGARPVCGGEARPNGARVAATWKR